MAANVPIDKLLEETPRYGFIPAVVMEFSCISVGGGIHASMRVQARKFASRPASTKYGSNLIFILGGNHQFRRHNEL